MYKRQAVPTVVVGLVVALLLWRSGPLGDLELIYTLRGMVVAQVLIAAPLVTGITLAALQLLPADLPDQLRALGATRTQLVVRLWLEARLPLLAAAMAGFRHRRGGHEVLRVEHLAVEPGERLAVLGPNGAGKTTLLRLLAGVERATSGSVLLDGTPTCTLDVGQRRRIGYVTQRPGLLSATVRRNVELPLAWRRVGRAERRRRAEEALALLGVAHLADRRAVRLSGGEQQRVSLARSLMLEPALLLLDEPAAGLDAPSRSAFLADLATALGGGPTTVVHVSHRPAEALRGADRVVVLVDGRVRQVGTPVEVVRSPADSTVATLVGYHNVLDARVDARGDVRVNGALAAADRVGGGPSRSDARPDPARRAGHGRTPGRAGRRQADGHRRRGRSRPRPLGGAHRPTAPGGAPAGARDAPGRRRPRGGHAGPGLHHVRAPLIAAPLRGNLSRASEGSRASGRFATLTGQSGSWPPR